MIIHVFLANNGAGFQFTASRQDSVESLNQVLARQTDIVTEDQILLCEDGIRLYSSWLLGHHPTLFETDEAKIYLFNRQHTKKRSQILLSQGLKQPIDVNAYRAHMPEQQLLNHSARSPRQGGSQNATPMTRAIMEYKHDFAHHVQVADAYVRAAQARMRGVTQVVSEQRVQITAIAVAVRNLNVHHSLLAKEVGEFKARFSGSNAWVIKTLDDLEKDLTELMQIELHARVREGENAGKSTLLDFVPEGELRAWASDCRKTSDHLRRKVDSLGVECSNAQAAVQAQEEPFPAQILDNMDRELKSWADGITLQEENKAILEKDYHNVHEIVAKMEQGVQASISVDILGYERLHAVHKDEIIPRCSLADGKNLTNMAHVVNVLQKSQSEVTDHYLQKLGAVSELSGVIRNLSRKVTLYNEAADVLKDRLSRITNLKRLPKAYRVSLEEIRRRLVFRKLFVYEVNHMADKLKQLRKEEAGRREQFQYTYGKFLPKKFVPGLRDTLPYCDIKAPGFDESLPNLLEGEEESVNAEVKRQSSKGQAPPEEAVLLENQYYKMEVDRLNTALTQELQSGTDAGRPTASPAAAPFASSSAPLPLPPSSSSSSSSSSALNANTPLVDVPAIIASLKLDALLPFLTSGFAYLVRKREEYNLQTVGDVAAFVPGDHKDPGMPADLSATTDLVKLVLGIELEQPSSLSLSSSSSSTASTTTPAAAAVSGDTKQSSAVQTDQSALKVEDAPVGSTPALALEDAEKLLNDALANNTDLELQLKKALDSIAGLSAENKAMSAENKKLRAREANMGINAGLLVMGKKELQERVEQLLEQAEVWKDVSKSKLSVSSFATNDLALFLKDPASGNFLGLHNNDSKDQPMLFLSSESSVALKQQRQHKTPDLFAVVGRILMIERKAASVDFNPHQLPEGTIYWNCTVEMVSFIGENDMYKHIRSAQQNSKPSAPAL